MGIFSPKDKSYLRLYNEMGDFVVKSAKILSAVIQIDSTKNESGGKAIAVRDREKAYADYSHQMQVIEEQADIVKRDISIWANTTFVTPFDREDMYRVGTHVDDIIDGFYETVDLIYLYKIDDLPKKAAKQVGILEDMAIRLFAILSGLSDIKVHHEELDKILELVIDCEKHHRKLLSQLFEDKKIDAVSLIKTKGLTDSLQTIAQAFKATASLIQMIAIKG
ncbi:MAG: DUF47 family protein [Candidatus Ancillula sp.]|jgi:uncharacterized protein Yka (UPF0111/DUF47 family)|nr:DUF47 family protein [Candidatus Ancillula sp.]